MAKIFIITYGCTANYDNTAIIKGILSAKKHSFATTPENADVIIINSCIVKGVTANKVRSTIRRFKKKNLVITGCMAEPEYELIKKLAPRASLVNTFHITKISDAVSDAIAKTGSLYLGKRREEKLGLPKIFDNKVSIQIAEGCIDSCFFCETKLAKGHVKSFSPEKIANELKKYVAAGNKSINITSTDNSCYGLDIKTNLPKLLDNLVSIKGNFKLRIGMMNPGHVKPYLKELIGVYKNKKIVKFLHIPVQSGSNNILKDMNRNHTNDDFRFIVNEFRKAIPGINISTDIIVGYSTEKEEDFEQTLNLIREIKPDVLNISKFAPRPGTKAAKLKQIPTEIIKERSRILTKEFRKIKK